ncbi:MAG: bifunctional precorrin-2 dehydrogenase/sirohydrochlorin ferrochelatase [bacterium]
MTYYPICLNLKNKKCLVVGGGKVALRKVKSLVEAQAKVTVISPKFSTLFKELENKITCLKEKYNSNHIKKDTFLVIAATNDKQFNAKIARDANKLNLLINVVDSPEMCNFIVPAIMVRGDLIISVSTSGKSPALARKIKEDLEIIYGTEYEALVDSLAKLRNKVKVEYKDEEERKLFWEKLLSLKNAHHEGHREHEVKFDELSNS